ncbi:MAG TPA: branched-chain amino acid ABC transporter permease [Actinomycetota bacterium]
MTAASATEVEGVAVRRRAVRPVVLASALLAAFALVWILFLSSQSAVRQPAQFIAALLDGLTLAGLYFLVASGFTLVFGLMRVVNLAHGSFFLLGGYIALQLQREWVGQGGGFGLTSADVDLFGGWLLPLVVATVLVAGIGLIVQQLLLRWNQGDELRQVLITIALSIIAADQMLAHFGGIAEDVAWPRQLDHSVTIPLTHLRYSTTRLFILALAIVVGVALWLWLTRTRMGAIIRAGVDDRQMVSALGINIQLAFALAFLVGAALAAMDGVVGGSFASLAPGVDAQWLLNSLVVVVIGGMGSLPGAALGALLYGLAGSLAATYLPAGYSYYSVIVTFVLLALVLAARPYGIFGRPA